MPDVSMEIQYLRQDGTLTYEGMTLFQDVIDELGAAITSLDGLSDVTITGATTGQSLTFNGTAWVNASVGLPVLLASKTASASATLDFTEFNNAVYSRYEFELENVLPATDSTGLQMRLSTNGGSSYDAGASDYAYIAYGVATGGTSFTFSTSAGAAQIILSFASDVGNAAGEEGVTGVVNVLRAASGSVRTRVFTTLCYENPSGLLIDIATKARRNTAQDTDAVRFLFSSGNIASGTIKMYGIV